MTFRTASWTAVHLSSTGKAQGCSAERADFLEGAEPGAGRVLVGMAASCKPRGLPSPRERTGRSEVGGLFVGVDLRL